MQNFEFERPFFVSKDALDTVNSITWFFADALWMLEAHIPATLFIIPTILTGLLLLYIEKRLPVTFINISINCWIWMNTLWMVSDSYNQPQLLFYSKVLFALGIIFILVSAFASKNLRETFSHFRRFRAMKWSSK